MIFEPELSDEDFDKIITAVEKTIYCGHSQLFWSFVKEMEFGDIALCDRCFQYFCKIKHLPWISQKRFSIKHNYSFPTFTNHLEGSFLQKIKPRIT